MEQPPPPPCAAEEVYKLSHAERTATSFDEVLWTVFFVTLVWITGKLAHRLGCPALVGEILIGGLLGPHLANVVPQHDALMLYGEVGLTLLVIEAGLDVDISMLRLIGLRGLAVAVTGSLAPLAIATLLAAGVLGYSWRSALALGCTLSPTSMGVALNVLKRGKVLNTPTGQLIIAAAVIDDVIALILLSELQALDQVSVASLLLPIVSSVGLILAGLVLGVQLVPWLMQRLKPKLRPKHREKLLLGLLLFLALLLVPACHALGSSHLLGAFLSGLSFCTDRDVHAAWTRQVKRLLQWLLRIFFAATIAFEIPIEAFASPDVLKGAAVLCLASIGKVATGVWAMPLDAGEFFKVGFAMAAWGEFAFITATTARSENIIDQTAFASVILAVVVSVVVAPVLLRLTIRRSNRSAVAMIEGASARDRSRRGAHDGAHAEVAVHYQLRTSSAPKWGLNAKLFETLSSERLRILDFRSQHDEERHVVTNELYLCDPRVMAPPTTTLSDAAEARVQRRTGELLALLTPHFADGGTVSLERWLPGAEQLWLDVESGPSAGETVKMATAELRSVDANADSSCGGTTACSSPQCVFGVQTSSTRAHPIVRVLACSDAPATSRARAASGNASGRDMHSDGNGGGIAMDTLQPGDRERNANGTLDEDEQWLASGYKSQRPTSLDGFVAEHRGARLRQTGFPGRRFPRGE